MLPLCWMFFTFLRSLGGLLQGLDDQGSSGGNDRAGGLPVLDPQLHSDLETFPVGGGLGDVISDLLGGKTERTDLGGKRAGGSDFATDRPQVDELYLIGVELGSHGRQMQISGSHVSSGG